MWAALARAAVVAVAALALGVGYLLNVPPGVAPPGVVERKIAPVLIAEGFGVWRRKGADVDAWARREILAQGMRDKVIVLTGGTRGLGKGAAGHAIAAGATLVLPCRKCKIEESRASLAREADEIRAAYVPSAAERAKLPATSEAASRAVFFDTLDLNDLDAIETTVSDMKRAGVKNVDALINNAGMVSPDPTPNKFGFEPTFAVNFLGTAHFTRLVLASGMMRSTKSRVVSVSSEDHRVGETVDEVLERTKRPFGSPWGEGILDGLLRYDYSKLLQTTYFLGLARETPHPVIDMCPGCVASEIAINKDIPWPIDQIVTWGLKLACVSPQRAGIPLLRLALDESLDGVTGKHYHIFEERPARADARDVRNQDRLLAWTRDLLKAKRAPGA